MEILRIRDISTFTYNEQRVLLKYLQGPVFLADNPQSVKIGRKYIFSVVGWDLGFGYKIFNISTRVYIHCGS